MSIDEDEQLQTQAKDRQDSQKEAQKEAEEAQHKQKEAAQGPAKPVEGAAQAADIPDTPTVRMARQYLQSQPNHLTADSMERNLRQRGFLLTTATRKALVQEEVRRRTNLREDQAQAGMIGQSEVPYQGQKDLQTWAEGEGANECFYVHAPVGSNFNSKLNISQPVLTNTTSVSGFWGFAHGLGMVVIVLFCFVALLFLCVLVLHGVAWIIERVIPWVMAAAYLAAFIGFVVLLPLSFIRFTKTFSANGLLLVSYVLGVWTWCYGFVVAYNMWGWVGIIVGLVLAGVGIVPVAMVAAAFKFEWWIVFDLLLYLGLTYGARTYSVYLTTKEEERKREGGTYAS
jgi:hypothetical protein